MINPFKKNLVIPASLLSGAIFLAVLTSSCNQQTAGQACVPTPPDTSALGKKDHFILKTDLEAFKKEYASRRDSIHGRNPNLFIPISETFNKTALINILRDPKSVGMRIYYGIKRGDRGNELRLILVGVDEQGHDLFVTQGPPIATQAGATVGGEEYGQCYPPCN